LEMPLVMLLGTGEKRWEEVRNKHGKDRK
jgi:hypothetical protein